ncbi:hypothetical protein C2E23DRAFT_880994 [Lenzites betulinus]|nr:hypothetical protein C2E23DRAFT_880994 [Lenzites betulinus]
MSASNSDHHSNYQRQSSSSSSSSSSDSSDDNASERRSPSRVAKSAASHSAPIVPARPTSKTAPHLLHDSTDGEDSLNAANEHIRRKKKRRKHAQPATRSDASEGGSDDEDLAHSSRHRRIDWSHGVGRKARDYMQGRYDEWANCLEHATRLGVLQEVQEHVVKNFRFPHHNSGDVRKCVKTWFRNTLRRVRTTATLPQPNAPAETVPGDVPVPLVADIAKELKKAIKGRARSGAALWAQENASTVQAHKEGKGIGDWQRAVKRAFKGLPEEEQAEWRARAKIHGSQPNANPNQCYDNQQLLPQLLGRVLNDFPGHGAQNFGPVVIYVRVGMRNREGVILREELTVGAREDLQCRSYASFEGGAEVDEHDRWERFLAMALPPNPIRGDPRLMITAEGRALLPQVDNGWSRDDIVAVLESYFRLSWAHVRGREDTLDWTTIITTPTEYLNAPWDNRCTCEPSKLNLVQVILLYSQLLDAQEGGDAFDFRGPQVLAQVGPTTATHGGSAASPPTPVMHERRVTPYVHSTPHTPAVGTRFMKVYPTPMRQSSASIRQPSGTPNMQDRDAQDGTAGPATRPTLENRERGSTWQVLFGDRAGFANDAAGNMAGADADELPLLPLSRTVTDSEIRGDGEGDADASPAAQTPRRRLAKRAQDAAPEPGDGEGDADASPAAQAPRRRLAKRAQDAAPEPGDGEGDADASPSAQAPRRRLAKRAQDTAPEPGDGEGDADASPSAQAPRRRLAKRAQAALVPDDDDDDPPLLSPSTRPRLRATAEDNVGSANNAARLEDASTLRTRQHDKHAQEATRVPDDGEGVDDAQPSAQAPRRTRRRRAQQAVDVPDDGQDYPPIVSPSTRPRLRATAEDDEGSADDAARSKDTSRRTRWLDKRPQQAARDPDDDEEGPGLLSPLTRHPQRATAEDKESSADEVPPSGSATHRTRKRNAPRSHVGGPLEDNSDHANVNPPSSKRRRSGRGGSNEEL